MIFEREDDTYFVIHKNRNVNLKTLSEKLVKFFKSEKYIPSLSSLHQREHTITAIKSNNLLDKLLDRQETWSISIKGDSNNFIVSVPYQKSRPQWFYILVPMIVQFGESYDREFLKKIDLVIDDIVNEMGQKTDKT